MKFDKYFPTERLQPYIKWFVVSENQEENAYKVLPTPGLVIGFQYKGKLALINEQATATLATAGISGISGSHRVFKSSADTGTVLVYFTETGLAHFASHPLNELFNLSISLDVIFPSEKVKETEEKLSGAVYDQQRIKIVEQFLLSQLKDIRTDKLIAASIKLIYESKGTIRIKELNEKLFISQSPFEKRFRKIVGTTPKKFASIVRFNSLVDQLGKPKSLTEIAFENNFFDQAHFIKDFKQFTGDTPEQFLRTR
jgi:AraC-like DNA-binding protein